MANQRHRIPVATRTWRNIRRSRLRIWRLREILDLALPTVIAQLSHTLMWTVDTALLGHHSSLALAAAGLGGIMTWAMYSLFNNLSRITGTFVAQAHGRGDDRAVGDYTWQGLYMALATGAILQGIGYASFLILPLTHNPAAVQSLTYVYIKWRTLSAIFTQLSFCLAGFYQGRKDVRIPMWAGIAGNVANVVLDIWLIFGWSGIAWGPQRLLAVPAMGVKGAAIATSIGTGVNAAILVGCLWPGPLRRRYRMHRPRRPDWSKMRDLIRVGSPAAWEGFIDMMAFTLFSVFIGRAGAISLAASQITIQILAFSFMPMWGLAQAGSILAGNWIGAGRIDRAADYGRQVYKLGLYYALGLALLLLLLRHEIFSIFSNDPQVVVLGTALVCAAAVFQIGDGLRMVGVGFLTGAGDTRYPMLQTLLILWGIFVPLTYLVVVRLGGSVITGWLGGAFCFWLQAVLLFVRFRSGRWQNKRIFSAAAATP
jgi:MATE family multidrug resistance protein